jgi:hypothetical protein
MTREFAEGDRVFFVRDHKVIEGHVKSVAPFTHIAKVSVQGEAVVSHVHSEHLALPPLPFDVLPREPLTIEPLNRGSTGCITLEAPACVPFHSLPPGAVVSIRYTVPARS